MPALDEVRQIELHVVAQVVEAELVVRAVGDVRPVRDLPFRVVQLVLDDADRHAEEPVDPAHPLRVAAGEVVVDGDDVDALAGERIQVRRQRRDERLALARLHFGDAPGVQNHAADELHVEVPHVQRPAAGLAHDGKRLGQQVVERFAPARALAQLRRASAQLGVGQRRGRGLELVDARDDRPQSFQLAFVLRADDLGQEGVDHAGGRRRLADDTQGEVDPYCRLICAVGNPAIVSNTDPGGFAPADPPTRFRLR